MEYTFTKCDTFKMFVNELRYTTLSLKTYTFYAISKISRGETNYGAKSTMSVNTSIS